MSSGCGCKEEYRFPHITYPYSSFLQLYTFCSFFVLVPIHFWSLFKKISGSLNKHKGDYGHSTEAV